MGTRICLAFLASVVILESHFIILSWVIRSPRCAPTIGSTVTVHCAARRRRLMQRIQSKCSTSTCSCGRFFMPSRCIWMHIQVVIKLFFGDISENQQGFHINIKQKQWNTLPEAWLRSLIFCCRLPCEWAIIMVDRCCAHSWCAAIVGWRASKEFPWIPLH